MFPWVVLEVTSIAGVQWFSLPNIRIKCPPKFTPSPAAARVSPWCCGRGLNSQWRCDSMTRYDLHLMLSVLGLLAQVRELFPFFFSVHPLANLTKTQRLANPMNSEERKMYRKLFFSHQLFGEFLQILPPNNCFTSSLPRKWSIPLTVECFLLLMASHGNQQTHTLGSYGRDTATLG